jgi:hypothetical protein
MDIKIENCIDCKLRGESHFVYCVLDPNDEVDLDDFDDSGIPYECPLKKENVTFMLKK